MSPDDSFFSRWSRRKALAQAGQPLPDPVPVPPAIAPEAPSPGPVTLASPPAPASAPGEPDQRPLPTLDDVAQLTPQSDFRPFVQRAVDPQVRNAAMKTLFSDPHFNVMDGLDIYIDDYSQPNPLPLELARKLTSAQFMKVFDEPQAEADTPAAALPADAAASDPTRTDPADTTLPDTRVTPDTAAHPPAEPATPATPAAAAPTAPQA